MKSANREPTTARKMPRPILDGGVAFASAKTLAAPCSSHGLDASPCRESHQAPITASTLRNRRMLPMGRSWHCARDPGLVLRQEILIGPRDAVIVGPSVD